MTFEDKSDAKAYAKLHAYKVVWFSDEGDRGILYKTKRDERNSERLADAGDVGHHPNSLQFDISCQVSSEDDY